MSLMLEPAQLEQVIAPDITPVDLISTVVYRDMEGQGRSGRAWLRRLRFKHHRISPEAQEIIEGSHFSNFPGNLCNLVIVRVPELVTRLPVDYEELVSAAAYHGYLPPHAEAGPVCRLKFDCYDLRRLGCLSAIVPHKPLNGKVLRIRTGDNINRFDVDTASFPIKSPLTAVVLWDHFCNSLID